MKEIESSASCIICQLLTVLSVFAILLYLLSLNLKCLYFIKMVGIYCAILINAVIVCLAWPLYFFGDVPKFVFDSFNVLSRWTNIKVVVRNGEILQKPGPFIFVCNHQSSVDIVVLSHFWPSKCTVMMKKSLKYVPFFNFASLLKSVMLKCGAYKKKIKSRAVFVDRFNREKAMQSLEECSKKITEQKLSVFIFPEGTRNHGDGMIEFKKGAFNLAVFAQIPIIPIVISSYKQFYNKNMRYFANSGYVIVEVMDPIQTTAMTIQDVPTLADAVRAKMMDGFAKISEEAGEEFKNRQRQISETKKNH
uniref:1-acyl-sn-glycerol-3-phosphate acyltransferase n=1 Tax=Wuchereria bancrofti TaxID=6293 RepID=A0A1I8EU66_WUCBA